jgi:hypothetical protein
MRAIVTLLALAATPVQSEEATDPFVEANLLSIFYHELGHALIDVMHLPVFGQEEDAADTVSILLIDSTFENETAIEIAYDAALGFQAEAGETANDIAWSDVHGPDLQRFYNLVCLFYGADPDNRDDFANDMGLPADRAEGCVDEFNLANDSWGPVIDEITAHGGGKSLTYSSSVDNFTADIISAEVKALNAQLQLPSDIKVSVESCGEANAFYDPNDQSIVICTEFETHLRDISPAFR